MRPPVVVIVVAAAAFGRGYVMVYPSRPAYDIVKLAALTVTGNNQVASCP